MEEQKELRAQQLAELSEIQGQMQEHQRLAEQEQALQHLQERLAEQAARLGMPIAESIACVCFKTSTKESATLLFSVPPLFFRLSNLKGEGSKIQSSLPKSLI